jgi:hypothetical protein
MMVLAFAFLLKERFKGVAPFPVVNKTKGERSEKLNEQHQAIVTKIMDIIK